MNEIAHCTKADFDQILREISDFPHPIANLAGEELDGRAREITPKVVHLLLDGQD
jgi:hypothetical protein